MTTINQTDHALIAAAYLSSASELARQGFEYDGADSQLPYAQVLATIAVAESILELARATRQVHAV